MQKATLITLIALVLIGGYFFIKKQESTLILTRETTSQVTHDTETDNPSTPSAEGDTDPLPDEDQNSTDGTNLGGTLNTTHTPETKTVYYTSMGFTPAIITVQKGDTIRFINNAGKEISISFSSTTGTSWSGDHVYQTGETYAHVFNQTGTYYSNDSLGLHGKIIVN